MTSGPITPEPKRPVEPPKGHGMLLAGGAWAGGVAAQLADRYPDAQFAAWAGLIVIVLVLSNVARRL